MANFGTSIDGVTDTAKTWALSADIKNIGNAVGRRITTQQGSLSYDLGYGFDVRNLLGAPITEATRTDAAREIEQQCMQDERIESAFATVEQSDTQSLKIAVKGTLSDATSFTLFLGVNSLTVALITAETAG